MIWKTKKYRSDAMAAIHETVKSLYVVGAIDKITMHRFDEACLTPRRTLAPEVMRSMSGRPLRRILKHSI